MKTCTKCGESKPADAEHFRPFNRAGVFVRFRALCRTCERARKVAPPDPMYRLVDPAPVRLAIEQSGDDLYMVAIRLGWHQGGAVDSERVRRALERNTIQLRTAVKILDAVDVLPAEVGL